MGKIILNNVRVYAYHGCLVEESKIGSDYNVHLEVEADLLPSSKSDNLDDTVDYVLLNKIITEEMAIRSKLLETVAKRIITSVLKQSEKVIWVKVLISKLNPPIGGDVAGVTISLEQKR